MRLSKVLLYLSAMLVLVIIMAGCSQTTTSDELDRINLLETRVTQLSEELVTLTNDTKGVIINSTEKGYDTVRTKNGYFFVSIDRIEPYLDGFKVYAQIGNPAFATFSDLKLTVRWSSNINYLMDLQIGITDIVNEAKKHIGEKEYTFTETLAPGSWTKINFVIPNVKAEDIKFIQFTIDTGSVALHNQG